MTLDSDAGTSTRGGIDRQPAYLRLYEQIRSSILSGQLPAGSRLPASRTLATEVGVSRNTVLAAFEQLQAEGYLVGKQGAGTFVADALPDVVVGAHHRKQSRSLDSPESLTKPAPALSRRGAGLAGNPRVRLTTTLSQRGHGAAFQVGLPAIDQFPLKSWNRMRAAHVRNLGCTLMGYNDPAGYPPLRQAIAGYIATARGINCTPEQVVIVSGSQQALDFCSRLLTDPGDPVWLEEPGYLGARAALESAGARIVPVPVDNSGMQVSAGIAKEPGARLAIVTPSHQFPLNSTMTLERRGALIEWAGANSSWILEDDYDNEFWYYDRPVASLQSIDPFGCVIYLGTFSKVLYPSLRLAYLIVPPNLVDAFVAAHLAADVHTHITEQAIVANFITTGHLARHVRRMRMIYSNRQEFLLENGSKILGDHLAFERTSGGLHVVARPHDETFDDVAAADRAMRRGVHLWPLSQHYVDTSCGRPGLLFGFAGANESQMLAALTRVRSALEAGGTAREGSAARVG